MREAEIKKSAVEHVWMHGTQMRDVAEDVGTRIIVGDVRGLGLLCGVERVRDRQTRERFGEQDDLPRRMTQKLRRRGLLTRVAGDVIPLAPPLVISRAEIDEVVGIVKASIEEFAGETGLPH